MAAVADVAELAGRSRPVSLAGDRSLPVLPALAPLLPGGLRRGSTVEVRAGAVGGTTSLALALAAGPSSAGGWCAAVGHPSLGVLAAAASGVALERFPLVPSPLTGEWPTIVAALLDAFDVIVAWPPSRPRSGDLRRLSARARERGSVLVVVGGAAVEGADARLAVVTSRWEGLGCGHGHLTGRVVEVERTGRGAASRAGRARLWLPAPGGGVEPYDDEHDDAVVALRGAR